MISEVIPLADAIRFLERRAMKILRPVRHGLRGRPLWLAGSALQTLREPFGVILIVAPSNYPLFLPAVQALQAIAAGNGVVIKASPGCAAPLLFLRNLAAGVGLDPALIGICDGTSADVYGAIHAGIDKVVLTGNANTGCQVLASLSSRLIPATMELSGCDACFILPGADMDLAVRSLAFGMAYNSGATCIAPRRCFVPESIATEFQARLAQVVAQLPPATLSVGASERLADLVTDAVQCGGRLVLGQLPTAADSTSIRDDGSIGVRIPPILISNSQVSMRLMSADIFAPVLMLISVADISEAMQINDRCPFALGASIFGPGGDAEALARTINAGTVVINDVIVPTADPRLSFSGRKGSGFGTTRGTDGLLEMTRPKSIVVRRGKFRPHLDAPHPTNEQLFLAYLAAVHGAGLWQRISALVRLLITVAGRNTSSPISALVPGKRTTNIHEEDRNVIK